MTPSGARKCWGGERNWGFDIFQDGWKWKNYERVSREYCKAGQKSGQDTDVSYGKISRSKQAIQVRCLQGVIHSKEYSASPLQFSEPPPPSEEGYKGNVPTPHTVLDYIPSPQEQTDSPSLSLTPQSDKGSPQPGSTLLSVLGSLNAKKQLLVGGGPEEERPYKCNICSAAFAHPANHRAHMRAHEGIKRKK